MKPTITKLKEEPKGVEICDMCRNGKPEYNYKSSMTNVHLFICHKCAIREYYGSKKSKRLINDTNNGTLFGNEKEG